MAPRDHPFPDPPVKPSVVITAKTVDRAATEARAAGGVAVITLPENRWGRCDIKTVGLLPNVLAKQSAREAGAAEAWFVDELGLVTEGGSSNAWIIDANGVLRTRDIQRQHPARHHPRNPPWTCGGREGLAVDERPFTPAEAKAAREAFITGAGNLIMPVVRVDGAALGDGTPGPVASKLRRLYIEQGDGAPPEVRSARLSRTLAFNFVCGRTSSRRPKTPRRRADQPMSDR